jgi:hypothetical protein
LLMTTLSASGERALLVLTGVVSASLLLPPPRPLRLDLLSPADAELRPEPFLCFGAADALPTTDTQRPSESKTRINCRRMSLYLPHL